MIGAPEPGPAESARPLLRLLGLARPLSGRLLAAAAAGAAATGCGVALLAVSGYLLARASQHPDIVALSVAVVAVRALSVGRGVSRYAERLASHDVAFRVLAQVRVTIWRRLEALAPAGLPAFSGDLVTRLVGDVDGTQDLFIRGIAPPLAAALAGSAAVVTCLAVLAPAGLALMAGLLAGGIIVPVLGVRAGRAEARRTAPARGELGAVVTDLLGGAADLHAFGAVDVALARAGSSVGELGALARTSAAASGLGTGLAALTAGLTTWVVLLLAVAAVGSGTLTRVPLAVVTLTSLASFEAVAALPAAATQLSRARTSARRITEVLDAKDPVADPPCPRPVPRRASPGTESLTVRLRRAQVRYRPHGPLALDGVSLDLPPGHRVALVGPNGAGKSTVAAVLLRFRDLAGGSATLGGHDLAGYRADDVRTVIGGCPQDPHLFDASIRENLLMARPQASERELTCVAARVGLLDWIDSLPGRLDCQVGPRGVAVSGGQRQRIALARALLADPAVLILDEPAAHLDARTRGPLVADLLAAAAGRATLLITHDLGCLDQVDEIIVLDQGREAERGTHESLLRAGGRYHQMWRATAATATP